LGAWWCGLLQNNTHFARASSSVGKPYMETPTLELASYPLSHSGTQHLPGMVLCGKQTVLTDRFKFWIVVLYVAGTVIGPLIFSKKSLCQAVSQVGPDRTI
jgi:hypothetical protein